MGLNKIKTIILALFFLIISVIPFTIIHEVGHSLACLADGNEFQIEIEIFAPSSMVCIGEILHLTLFNAAGGMLASMVAVAVIVLVRHHFIVIPMASIAISHMLNAIVEAGFYKSYVSADFWPAVFLFIDSIIFIGISSIYLRKHSNLLLKI